MNITLAAHPAAIQRKADGSWRHPDMPEFFPGDDDRFDAWVRRQGFQLHVAKERITEEDFAEWEPEPPEGDSWLTLEVKMTGAMASWIWARKVTT